MVFPIADRPEFARLFKAPLSLAAAEDEIARILAARPDVARPARGDGRLSGVAAIRREHLPAIYRHAANQFHGVHGRLPDPVDPQGSVALYFAVKFVHAVPMRPNPADKLECWRYLSAALRGRVGIPRRVWASATPGLPPDDAVPPGRYWLKKSNGNQMQEAVQWPPDRAARARLTAQARRWWSQDYGIDWGEWWYAVSRPRLLLEEDLSPAMAGRPECRMLCRGGRVRVVVLHRTLDDGTRTFSLFDPDFRPLPGRIAGHARHDEPVPEALGLMVEAAEDIARHFDFVRVDFLNATGPHPYFGEITLCPGNATQRYDPPGFDGFMGEMLAP